MEQPRSRRDDARLRPSRAFRADQPLQARGRHAGTGLGDDEGGATPADARMICTTTASAGLRRSNPCGRRHPREPPGRQVWTTPAGAGTTSRGSCRRGRRWSDPRECGDGLQVSTRTADTGEQPPRTGTTRRPAGRAHARRSNTCGRGDDAPAVSSATVGAEQPRRAQGRRTRYPAAAPERRTTLAGTRTTPRCHGAPARRSSNPRGCGDDEGLWRRVKLLPGQPPRARGRRLRRESPRPPVGPTPRGAGTTRRRPRSGSASWSNPCGRGDDGDGLGPGALGQEQPPRARERRQGRRVVLPRGRATAAGAGTTGR